MVAFVGRETDLARLQGHLDAVVAEGGGRLLAIRGRRQVGKSALLTRFVDASPVPSVYMTAVKNAATSAQLADLADAVRTSTHPDASLFDEEPTSWADALQRVAALARGGPLVVVVDEYPWAAAAEPALDSRIQVAWDRTLERLPVLLVLVGSDLSVMERTVAHDAPLYGRARQMLVEPFSLADTRAALQGEHDGRSTMEVVDTYLVTGGYPRLVQGVSREASLRSFVASAVADPFSELVVTGRLTLDAELPSTVPARAVLEAVGHDERGPAVVGSIVDRLPSSGGTARAQVSRAIEILQDKRLLAIDTPVGSQAGSRRRRYRVSDPYLRFWLRFLGPRLGDVERGRPDLVLRGLDAGWESWRGRAVEPVVRSRLWRASPDLAGLSDVTRVGGWWDRSGQTEIDLVLARDGQTAGIGTIKWRDSRPIGARDLRELDAAAASLPGAAQAKRIAVCPAGVDVDVDVAWTADDLVRSDGTDPALTAR